MQTNIEQLVQLSDLDEECDRVRSKIERARADVVEAEAHRDACVTALHASKASLDDELGQERALQRKIEQYEKRVARAVTLLETGGGDAAAAEKQRVQCLQIIDDTETELLESMQRVEDARASLAAAKETLANAEDALVAVNERVPGELATLEGQLATLTAQRNAIHADIPSEERLRYDQLRARRRPAVVRVYKKACAKCLIAVQAQMVQELKRGLMVTCRGCGRWLTLPEE